MMERAHIRLDPETLRRARRRASELGISLAELVRRSLSRDLGGERRTGDPSALFDLGRSGGSNVAADKDRMLGEAAQALSTRGSS